MLSIDGTSGKEQMLSIDGTSSKEQMLSIDGTSSKEQMLSIDVWRYHTTHEYHANRTRA